MLIRASFGDFRIQFKFLAGVSSLEFLFLLFQDKRKINVLKKKL